MRSDIVSYSRPAGLEGVELLSCATAGVDFPPHVHEALTLWLNGTCAEYFTFKGNTSILTPQGFGVVNPGEVHANGDVNSNKRHLQTIYIDPDTLHTILPDFTSQQLSIADGLYTDTELHTRLRFLHSTLQYEQCPLYNVSLLTQTIETLFTRYAHKQPVIPTTQHSLVMQVRDYIHENVAHPIYLEHLAQIADCSPNHLIRLFSKQFGLSPHAYTVRLRVARAKKLLLSSSSLAEVAMKTGFADQSHLTRWFKKLTGTTPARYRTCMCS